MGSHFGPGGSSQFNMMTTSSSSHHHGGSSKFDMDAFMDEEVEFTKADGLPD